QVAQKKLEEKQIEEERAAKAKYWKLPVCYDDDDVEERSDSLDDNIISELPSFSAIIPDEPDFSKSNKEFSSIDDDSFSNDDIDYVEASPLDPELVSSEVMEIVILETQSSSTSLNYLLEETNTFDNSLPEFETVCFNVEEISSGSPTTHSDSSLYASFIFDLSIDPFTPADMIVPYYLLSLRNEDIIFDPGICKSTFSRSDISHRCGTVKKFNTHRSHLNKCPMLIHGQNNPPLDVLLFHFYPP
nr:hypothetical protein [Tanacetum cinerariifolium]